MDIYDIVKALHIIAIVCWFAGLFYLPRLFVYHTTAHKKSLPMLKTMENKLFFIIMKPSMLLTWGLGLWLLYLSPHWVHNGWMHLKLLMVIFLTGYHHVCGAHVKRFFIDENKKSEKYFRIFNEIPVVFLIIIVLLVVLKPF